jgi:uncharacterized membrane protein YeaQ/YmgE (transglycosylase-associated protein family)
MGLIISLVITGLIVGALGRLAIPGPNPMSIGKTILVGLGGAIIGGIVGRVISANSPGVWIVLEVLAAAGIVYLMQRNEHGKVTPPGP